MDDVLLKEVSHALERLTPLLGALLRLHPEISEQLAHLERQLLLLEWRSRDVRKEFAGFYCVRLLLDEQSPLATYFIDLFTQLTWILHEALSRYQLSPDHHLLRDYHFALAELHRCVIPAIHTCRLLYASYRMLPMSKTIQGQRSEGTTDFKRKGRHGRRFSWNELHCRIRGLGFVNLDRQGITMVRLQEKLGEGASASVYKGVFEADDEKAKLDSRTIIGDPVAVKMFSNGKSEHMKFGSNFSSRLLQSMEHMTQNHEQSMTHNGGIIEDVDGLSLELRRLVSARHPNIVTPKGYIGMRPQGESGLVMELMDESLHDYLGKVNNGSLPCLKELDMLDLMLEIAKGMRFLHECDLIHRDLKPQNVLLRFSADYEDLGCKLLEVKLADFGLAKLCDFAQGGSSIYRQTSFRGTSCYMAPELRGDAPSQELPYQLEKVDVFSYGTTCFNIITRNPNALAFSSQSVKAFYKAVKTGEWKQWVQDFDIFVNLIARCWQAEPARRPTFAELCVLLQAAMQDCLLQINFDNLQELKFQNSNVSRTIMASSVYSFVTHRLSNLQKDFKLHHSNVYRTIMAKMLDTYKGVGGARAITKSFLDFESTIPAHHKTNQPPTQPQIFPNGGAQTSDFARDVSIIVEAMRKGHFNAGKEYAKSTLYSTFLIGFFLVGSYLNKTDPLLFIKGLACFNLINQYYSPVEGSSTLSSTYAKYGFDYKNDEAFCELEVDTSLIPLLVGLWLVGKDSNYST